METPADPNRKNHQVQASERTLAILRAVLDHPGNTVKQLRPHIAGTQPSDQSLRDHLGLLLDGGWVRRTFLGQIVVGPTLVAGARAISDFQMLLARLRQASAGGMEIQELVEETGLTPRAVSAAMTIGIEFDCITPVGDDRFRLNADGLLLPPCTVSDEDLHAVLKHFTTASGHDAALVRLSQVDGLILSHLQPAPDGTSLLADIGADAAHATAGGQAVLSWVDDSQRDRFLETHGMRAFTDRTPTTIEALGPMLVREPGRIYTAEGQYCKEGACLAVLVRNGPRTDDRIVLSTSVRLDRLEHDRERLRSHLRDAAVALGNLIDGPLPPVSI
jgi:DNA-binding IclR family transcriptional regulator